MQYISKGGIWVCGIVLGEEAIVHCSCSSEQEKQSTGNQLPPADRLEHRLIEADGEEHEQKAKDHEIRVQNPCVLSNAQIAHHLMDGRVAWTKEAINGESEHKKKRTDYPGKCKWSYIVDPFKSHAIVLYLHLCHQFEAFHCFFMKMRCE